MGALLDRSMVTLAGLHDPCDSRREIRDYLLAPEAGADLEALAQREDVDRDAMLLELIRRANTLRYRRERAGEAAPHALPARLARNDTAQRVARGGVRAAATVAE